MTSANIIHPFLRREQASQEQNKSPDDYQTCTPANLKFQKGAAHEIGSTMITQTQDCGAAC